MDFPNMRLMIVDNHASTREMIRKFLGLPGITFCECASGDEAVRLAREFKPDWVTMDVQMPGRNGFEATRALRAEHPPARVMIITADNQPHYPQLSRAAGAVGLLSKHNLLALRLLLEQEMGVASPPAPSGKKPPPANP